MTYPSLEQYTEALQSPHIAILDPELKRGRLKTTGLGLPLALCGGFALTYTVEVSGKKFALRCFHKHSPGLEKRYAAIATKIKQLNSPYFLPFEFIREGIRIQGANYPIVKMAWAQGQTLAEFLENEHKNKGALQQLRGSLSKLADFIERNQIAHGDIQPENLMVSGNGATIQLIDYDGMFVDVLNGSQATEYGQMNFQHPKRSADHFNQHLDRFSFIALDVAIQSLIAFPALWGISKSEPSAVVFRRNDFIDPAASSVFHEIMKLPGLKSQAENLAKIAAGSFNSIPSLVDFLQGKGISNISVNFERKAGSPVFAYQTSYTVCNASDFTEVIKQEGNRVELIGKIIVVNSGVTRKKSPRMFINFSNNKSAFVSLTIWSDGLDALAPLVPDDDWVGKWVSVTGLINSPYCGRSRFGPYTSIGITITRRGEIQRITEQEAQYRLGAIGAVPKGSKAAERNSDILKNMAGSPTKPSISIPKHAPQLAPKPAVPKSANQQLLEKMRAQTPVVTQPSASPTVSNIPQKPKPVTHAGKQSTTPKKTSWITWAFLGFIGFVLLRACSG